MKEVGVSTENDRERGRVNYQNIYSWAEVIQSQSGLLAVCWPSPAENIGEVQGGDLAVKVTKKNVLEEIGSVKEGSYPYT